MRKLIIGIVVLFLIFGIITYAITPKVEYWTYYTVDTGDTLWDIVTRYNPEYEWKDEIINMLKRKNGLRTSQIYGGDTLEVPVMEVD